MYVERVDLHDHVFLLRLAVRRLAAVLSYRLYESNDEVLIAVLLTYAFARMTSKAAKAV